MSKKIFIPVGIFIVLIISVCIYFFNMESVPIKKEGSYQEIFKYLPNENISDNGSDIADLYLEKITYKIEKYKKIDNENGKATITVSVPNFEIIIKEAINEIISQSESTTSYNDLLNMTKEKISARLSSQFEVNTTTMEIDLKKVDNEWQIIPNDEWEYVTKGYLLDVLLENYRKLISGG